MNIIDKLFEKVIENDKWINIKVKLPIQFKYYNPSKKVTIWCKYEDKMFTVFINQGPKTAFNHLQDAKDWAKKKMKNVGGQQIII